MSTTEKKSAKTSASPAAAPKLSKAKAEHAASLLSYGKIVPVRFGDLVREDNIRGCPPSHEDMERLRQSIEGGGMQERFHAFKRKDGKYQIVAGGTRHECLVSLKFPPEAMIEVVEIDEPKNRAENRTIQLTNNLKNPMQWPDVVRAVGEALGVIDETGKPYSPAVIRQGVKSGRFKSHEQLGQEAGLDVSFVGRYARMAQAPYEDLVTLWRLGATVGHGEVYARFAPETRPAMLSYYQQHRKFPEDAAPLRERAPGAGRPRKGETAETSTARRKAGDTSKPKAAAPKVPPFSTLQADAKTITSGSESSVSAPPQRDLFDTPVTNEPTTPPVSSATAGYVHQPGGRTSGHPDDYKPYVRPDDDLAAVCDRFGISPAQVRLFDEIANAWGLCKLEDWGTNNHAHVEAALSRFDEAEEEAAVG